MLLHSTTGRQATLASSALRRGIGWDALVALPFTMKLEQLISHSLSRRGGPLDRKLSRKDQSSEANFDTSVLGLYSVS